VEWYGTEGTTMYASIALFLAVMPAAAMDLNFHEAAEAHGVPEGVLKALAWEASRWDPGADSAWGGHGLFDFGGAHGPDLGRASSLVDRSPKEILSDPAMQIDAAAALLHRSAELWARGGVPPAVDDLAAWWGPVRAFSGRHAPNLQAMYADYILQTVALGVPMDPTSGLWIEAEPGLEWGPPAPPLPGECDYAGCDQFVPAHVDNYSDYSRGPNDIDYVIVHTVQGSYSGCISWFQNPDASVSAHYVVRSSDGAVTQMVGEDDVGWHAGNWDYNLASVGIEHEGYVDAPETWYTDEMYAGSGALTADIIARNGISLDRSHIIGHNEVPGATHTDPGDGWDWDRYLAEVGGSGGGTQWGNLVGLIADEDIYTGAPLVGATVWIDETGEAAQTDGDGHYRFEDLPLETYTVKACHEGYLEGSCVKDLSIGDNWCSIALVVGEGGCGEPDSGDAGGDDGGGLHFGAEDPPQGFVPGGEPKGCGCASAAAGGRLPVAGLVLFGLLAFSRRRRSGLGCGCGDAAS
jgi:MYXO-CTERM domain-containing protein